ncbi:MAG: heat-inducible transcriptional repressor HrcA [Simkania sp.]|nr:heat-inducible transcriptional repressor HrcA [Simkania sp.]
MKKLLRKKPAKDQREYLVLLGLVDLYLQTGKPIGSNTLRENGFESLSSATIRNYFSKLESGGYLRQQHSSGGRIPTSLAYKTYAESIAGTSTPSEEEEQAIKKLLERESREVASYLQEAAEKISELTHCAVFLSAPRFDQDFILDTRFVGIDQHRCLCALVTDFGLIHTEILYTDKKLSSFSFKRIESYFQAKLAKQPKPVLPPEELKIAERFYQEVMLRRIASHANFSSEDIYRTGFSQLIGYPDFNDASILASGLALFENTNRLRHLLAECSQTGTLSCWIGDDLAAHSPGANACSVIAIPYKINQTIAGSIAILGPNRIPYRKLFGTLQRAAECISHTLTCSLYKFKITFRLPTPQAIDVKTPYLLIEDQRGTIDE